MISRSRIVALLLVFACCWGSCLEFDAQDIVARYDAEKDQLDLLMVYRGLHVENRNRDSAEESEKKALEDLRTAMNHGQMALWENWPVSLDPVKQVDPPVGPMVERFLDVETGGLFTDMQGQLCGYQFVRIRNVKKLLKSINPLLGLAIQVELGNSANRDEAKKPPVRRAHIKRTLNQLIADDETLELVTDALRGGHQFLSISEDGLQFTMPCSAAFHRQIRVDLLRRLVVEATSDLEKASKNLLTDGGELNMGDALDGMQRKASDPFDLFTAFGAFSLSDFEWYRVDEETSALRIGIPGSETFELHKPPSHGYKPGLLETLRELDEFKIEERIPDQELERRFDAFHDREAKLSPGLAAMRK